MRGQALRVMFKPEKKKTYQVLRFTVSTIEGLQAAQHIPRFPHGPKSFAKPYAVSQNRHKKFSS